MTTTTDLPQVHDKRARRHGVIDTASSARLSVIWNDGFTTTYTAAKVAAEIKCGAWLISIPQAS